MGQGQSQQGGFGPGGPGAPDGDKKEVSPCCCEQAVLMMAAGCCSHTAAKCLVRLTAVDWSHASKTAIG